MAYFKACSISCSEGFVPTSFSTMVAVVACAILLTSPKASSFALAMRLSASAAFLLILSSTACCSASISAFSFALVSSAIPFAFERADA